MVLNHYRLQFLLKAIDKRRKKLDDNCTEDDLRIQHEFYTLRLDIFKHFDMEDEELNNKKLKNEEDTLVDGSDYDEDELDIEELQYDLDFGIDSLGYYDLNSEFCNTRKDSFFFYTTLLLIFFSGFYFTSMLYLAVGLHMAMQPVDDETERQDTIDSVTITRFATRAFSIGQFERNISTSPMNRGRLPNAYERISGYNDFTYFITGDDCVDDEGFNEMTEDKLVNWHIYNSILSMYSNAEFLNIISKYYLTQQKNKIYVCSDLETLYLSLQTRKEIDLLKTNERNQTFFKNVVINKKNYLRFKREVNLHYKCNLVSRYNGEIAILYLNF